VAVKPPGPVDTDEDAAPAPEKEPESHGVLGFLKELLPEANDLDVSFQ